MNEAPVDIDAEASEAWRDFKRDINEELNRGSLVGILHTHCPECKNEINFRQALDEPNWYKPCPYCGHELYIGA